MSTGGEKKKQLDTWTFDDRKLDERSPPEAKKTTAQEEKFPEEGSTEEAKEVCGRLANEFPGRVHIAYEFSDPQMGALCFYNCDKDDKNRQFGQKISPSIAKYMKLIKQLQPEDWSALFLTIGADSANQKATLSWQWEIKGK